MTNGWHAKRGGARKGAAKKGGARKRSGSSGRRELIAPKGDKRYTRRTASGRFADNQDDVGRSLSRDVKKKARKTVKAGYGDLGDQKRKKSTKKAAKKSAGKKSGRKTSAKKSGRGKTGRK